MKKTKKQIVYLLTLLLLVLTPVLQPAQFVKADAIPCVVTGPGNDAAATGTLNYWLSAVGTDGSTPACSTITFNGDMTILGPILIDHDVTIDGEGNNVTITGETDGVPYQALVNVGIINNTTPNPTATIKNLILTYGAGGSYAPVQNFGTLTLDHIRLVDNFGRVGSIFNMGTLNILDSHFATTGTNFNNGVLNTGTLNVTRTTFSNNIGTIWNNTFGGVYSPKATISDSTFASSTSREGLIWNDADWKRDNNGEPLYGVSGELAVTNSTFYGNTTANHPDLGYVVVIAIRNEGSMALTNNTFANNQGPVGAYTLYNDNRADPSSTIKLFNNIFVEAADPTTCAYNFYYPLISNASSNNLFTGYCGRTDIPAPAGFTLKTREEINLDTLGNNGGATQTIPLLPNSAAIDMGDDSACPDTDQRGVTRPQGAHCDVGAYEYEQAVGDAMLYSLPTVPAVGQPVLLGVRMDGAYPFSGNVTFYDGETAIEDCTNLPFGEGYFGGQYLDFNPVQCTTSGLSEGAHTIHAKYTREMGPYLSQTYSYTLPVGFVLQQKIILPEPSVAGYPMMGFHIDFYAPVEYVYNASIPYTCTIDFGDGKVVAGKIGTKDGWSLWTCEGDQQIDEQHTYSNTGTYNGTFTIQDLTGNTLAVFTTQHKVVAAGRGYITATPNPVTVNGAVTFTANLENFDYYYWMILGQENPIGSGQSFDFTFTETGTYKVMLLAMKDGTSMDTSIFLQDGIEVTVNSALAQHTISGTVFYDTNENGVMDADETGVDFTDPALPYSMIGVRQDCGENVVYYNATSTDGTFITNELADYHSYCFSLNAASWSKDYRITNYPVKIDSLEANMTGVNIGLAPASLTVTPAKLPAADLNQPYTATITISGGTPPYTLWTQPVLPEGLTATFAPWAGTITIEGTPTQAGAFGGMYGIRDDMYVYAYYSPMIIVRSNATFELTSNSNPAVVGEEVAFSLAGTGISDELPAFGDVTFYADGVAIPGCTDLELYERWEENPDGEPVFVDNNPVVCRTSTLTIGEHTITASFSNGILYYDATVSLTGTQTILPHLFTWTSPVKEGGTGTFTASLPDGAAIMGWGRSTSPGGSTCEPLTVGPTSPVEINFFDNGSYLVCLNWRLGNVVYSNQQTVTVENIAPVAIDGSVSITPEPSMTGTSTQAVASFADYDHLISCTVDYGDGSGTQSATIPVDENACLGVAHTYTTAGTFTVTFTATDPNGASGTATISHTVISGVQADLSLTKTDSKDPIKPGATLVYTLMVSNSGPNAAQSVILTDKLDPNTTYVSVSAPKGWTCKYASNSGTVTCISASLSSGSSAMIKITVTVNKTARVGKELVNTAQVSSATSDPNMANNTVTQKTMVTK